MGCAISILLGTTPAFAHPHAYIDVSVGVRFDDQGRIAALEESWLVDPAYSAYISKGLAFSKDRTDAGQLAGIATTMLHNLARFSYMTHAQGSGRNVDFAPPLAQSAAFEGGRLRLRFTLPLREPVSARNPFEYSIYDPTYYIEMLHAEHGAIRLVNAPAGCRYTLHAAHPDPAKVAQAAALDRASRGDPEMGRFFAERVSVQCGAAAPK